MRVSLLLIVLLAALGGCIKEVHPRFRTTGPFLVVEGLLRTDSVPCQVTLSYSGIFNENGAQLPLYVDDATVYVRSDGGDSIPLVHQQGGLYLSQGTGPVGEVGKTYTLCINLADGRRYASQPEKVVPVPHNLEIDSIGLADFNVLPLFPDLHGADVMIRFQDPADRQNYYRWTCQGYLPRQSTGVPCAPFDPQVCHQYCYQAFQDHTLRIFSDEHVNGSEIRYHTIQVDPYYGPGRHFLAISQMSITREAFQFWELYEDQTNRTGSILDPLPSPLQGNIYNVHDSSDLALGYFGASDVYVKKVILKPLVYNSLVFQYASRYFPQGACAMELNDAQEETPAGWESAEEITYEVH